MGGVEHEVPCQILLPAYFQKNHTKSINLFPEDSQEIGNQGANLFPQKMAAKNVHVCVRAYNNEFWSLLQPLQGMKSLKTVS